ncbi:hypothetical protein [Streptomyces sp. SAI-041]|uniref:hypothetical protein n=1 Tax=Streptomyces sp. SAI-041 TaxID=2940548 RepID=UPI00247DEB4E|nr:hypothetical protein [Streptomyces sp. SAI-041]
MAVAAALDGAPVGVAVPVGEALPLDSALGEEEGGADDCVEVAVGEEAVPDGPFDDGGGASGTPARTPPATEPSREGLS